MLLGVCLVEVLATLERQADMIRPVGVGLLVVTRPTSRVLTLLEILQSGGTWPVRDLAERFGVDERTVRRYAAHLADLNVPVRSLRGRYRGYRLAPGFRVPPLMFTDDEAVAVVFGLVTVRRTAPGTVPATSLDSALAKLRRVLPEPLGRRLDALLAAPTSPPLPPPAAAASSGSTAAGSSPYWHSPKRPKRDDRWPRTTPTGTAGTAAGWCTRTGSSCTPGAGTSWPPTPSTGRCATSGWTRSPRRLPELAPLTCPRTSIPSATSSTASRTRLPAHRPGPGARLGRAGAGAPPVRPGLGRAGRPARRVRIRVHAERLDWMPALLAGLDLPSSSRSRPPSATGLER